MAYEVRILIIFYISRISKTELILENQQTWREKNSDLKESLERMKKKRYGALERMKYKDMEHMEET